MHRALQIDGRTGVAHHGRERQAAQAARFGRMLAQRFQDDGIARKFVAPDGRFLRAGLAAVQPGGKQVVGGLAVAGRVRLNPNSSNNALKIDVLSKLH